MKKIVAFCEGDSTKLSTWSNVPFLCLKALENGGGYCIERIDISKHALGLKWYMKPVNTVYTFAIRCYRKLLGRNTMVDWFRSRMYENYVKREMSEYMLGNQNAIAQIVFDFSHISNDRNIPTILFCDWTIEYKILSQWKRQPRYFEQKIIQRQWDTMNQADAIVTIFPHSYQLLRNRFGDKVYYWGHIINAVEEYKQEAVEERLKNCELLFIGKLAYKSGLQCLIKVVNFLNSRGYEIKINAIGMNKEDIDSALEVSAVNFYGYLNKSDEEQCRKYYQLLNRSRCLINVTSGWNGASSILEAIYFGLSVIISRNDEMDKIFGQDCPFVLYCDAENENELVEKIKELLSVEDEEYKKDSSMGHAFASRFTWERFSEKLAVLIEALSRNNIER